ncbi:MAG: aldo/keto reductase [Muribaculaceae bacterium]|nr:aldo/keto reductase [Muribaculaceae bacterium]
MDQPKNSSGNISRRSFLRFLGAGALLGAVTACGVDSSQKKSAGIPGKQTGEMTRRLNQNTGDSVSVLGYGMMRLPMNESGPEEARVKVIDQEEVNRLVDYALEHGVNYFDTAPVYCQGKSEEATGIALSRHPRDSYYIATKLSNFSPESQSREKSMEMFENSLRYLQTDYIDYLLLHAIGGGGMQSFNTRFVDNGILDWLIEQKKTGRIRNLGFSFHGDAEVFDTMLQWMDEGKVHWDFVQIQLNYIDWNRDKSHAARNTDAEYLYNELAKREIPAVIMEPLLGGRLANLPDPIVEKMKSLRPSDSVASWAFRFAGTPPGVLTVLSGMTYMDHLQDNIATYSSLEPISADEDEFLKNTATRYLAADLIPCTDCKYCMPCPYGLDIPAIFAHYNKCVNDDNMPWDRKDSRYAEARRAYLVGYDRSVPKMRQASRCIGCKECESHCPQEIKISRRMREIDDYTSRLRSGKV